MVNKRAPFYSTGQYQPAQLTHAAKASQPNTSSGMDEVEDVVVMPTPEERIAFILSEGSQYRCHNMQVQRTCFKRLAAGLAETTSRPVN